MKKVVILVSVCLAVSVSFAGCGGAVTESNNERFVQGGKSLETVSSVTGEHQGNAYNTILVLGLMQRESVRESVEDAMVKRLVDAKVGAVPSYQALSPDKEITKEFLESQLKDTGVDAVLTVRLKDIGTEITPASRKEIPSSIDEPPVNDFGGRDFYGYYADAVVAVQSPGFAIVNERVEVLTRLFAVEDAAQVWQGKFTTFNPNNRTSIVNEIATQILEQLSNEGMINNTN